MNNAQNCYRSVDNTGKIKKKVNFFLQVEKGQEKIWTILLVTENSRKIQWNAMQFYAIISDQNIFSITQSLRKKSFQSSFKHIGYLW